MDRHISRRSLLGGAGALTAGAAIGRKKSSTRDSAVDVPNGAATVSAALAALGKTSLRHPGSLPFPDLPAGTDTMPQIEHIVMLMMENHSFDNFLGCLPPSRGVDGFAISRSDPSTWPAWNPNGVVASNPSLTAGLVQNAFHMPTTCQHSGSPTQEWSACHEQYDGGKMDGFVTCVSYGMPAPAGPVGMAYWNEQDLPVLYCLADAFPLADRWFQSLLGQTDPNRRYLIAGTSIGMVDDIDLSTSGVDLRGTIQDLLLPVPANGTIFDLLAAFDLSFVNYTASYPVGTTAELYPDNDAALTALNEKSFDDFFADCAAGTLPAFSFLDENYDTQSQENPQDIVVGEQLIHDVVTALAGSPNWGSTLLILNYDEHGGYYDHVGPPVALAPDTIPPVVEPGQAAYDGFSRYGFRVPALVVSPYARPGGVTHRLYDHASVLAMMERKWNLPALTFRDANANDLMDFLDLSGPARPFEEFLARAGYSALAGPAPSNCPAVAPSIGPEGSVTAIPWT
jgi:phospholipase C